MGCRFVHFNDRTGSVSWLEYDHGAGELLMITRKSRPGTLLTSGNIAVNGPASAHMFAEPTNERL